MSLQNAETQSAGQGVAIAAQPTLPETADAVIIGAGHNGLTAATYLAKAGWQVVVLEARESIGGMAGSQELEPGFMVPHCAHLLHSLSGEVVKDLNLHKYGLGFAQRRMATTGVNPDGETITVESDLTKTRSHLAAGAPADVAAYGALMHRMNRLAEPLKAMKTALPDLRTGSQDPRLPDSALRKLGPEDARHFAHLLHGRVADLLDTEFDSPLLKGLLAFDSCLGGDHPPRSPGSALHWLYRQTGRTAGVRGALGQPKGGIGALAEALSAAAQDGGAEIAVGVPVRSILHDQGRICGVLTGTGQMIRSGMVLSSLDPQTTYLGLLGPEHLDVETVRRLKRWRSRGVTAKINLTLDELPLFRALKDGQSAHRLVLGAGIEDLEAAYRPVKYGDMSTVPVMEVVIPTLHDPGLAPEGRHIMSIIVQYVPYLPDPAANETLRRRLASVAVERLAAYAPDLPGLVREVDVMTPRDLETIFGVRGGHWHQGDLSPDQAWHGRRFSGTGTEGLILCGAGSHPGGGVTGLCGKRAAAEALGLAKAAA